MSATDGVGAGGNARTADENDHQERHKDSVHSRLRESSSIMNLKKIMGSSFTRTRFTVWPGLAVQVYTLPAQRFYFRHLFDYNNHKD